jgi:hypothetical protein
MMKDALRLDMIMEMWKSLIWDKTVYCGNRIWKTEFVE